jgi:hypothetical protein
MARTLPELGAAVVAFLNGLTHHLMAERSDPERYEYARIGYELAPKFDPNNWLAAQQLGRLSLSLGGLRGRAGEFRARPALPAGRSRAPVRARAGFLLSGDMETAFAAINRALELQPTAPEIVAGTRPTANWHDPGSGRLV